MLELPKLLQDNPNNLRLENNDTQCCGLCVTHMASTVFQDLDALWNITNSKPQTLILQHGSFKARMKPADKTGDLDCWEQIAPIGAYNLLI